MNNDKVYVGCEPKSGEEKRRTTIEVEVKEETMEVLRTVGKICKFFGKCMLIGAGVCGVVWCANDVNNAD